MGIARKSLPEGGAVVYDTVHIGSWLRAEFRLICARVAGRFFADRFPGHMLPWLGEEMDRNIAHAEALFEDAVFMATPPARWTMAYGFWVKRELYFGLMNRLEIAGLHAAWHASDGAGRVRLVSEVLFESVVWCVLARGAAWHGHERPVERPFWYEDDAGVRHRVAVEAAPTVFTFGPGRITDE